MSGPREGYPRVNDPAHPLWEAQEDGWPDHLPHEAWAAVAQHEVKKTTSSSAHPAFAFGYLTNTVAVTEEKISEPAPLVTGPAPKERR